MAESKNQSKDKYFDEYSSGSKDKELSPIMAMLRERGYKPKN